MVSQVLPLPSYLILPKTLINTIFIDMQNTSVVDNVYTCHLKKKKH